MEMYCTTRENGVHVSPHVESLDSMCISYGTAEHTTKCYDTGMQTERHHAVVYEGNKDLCQEVARTYVRDVLGLTIEQNPDIVEYTYERLGVDDARALKERAAQSPLGELQVFILSLESGTREAQNALLKLLEEPQTNTHFVVIVPTVQILLDTVRSRLSFGGRCIEATDTSSGQQFLTSTPAERLKLIEPMVKNKDKRDASELLDSIEKYLHMDPAGNAQDLNEISFVRTYLRDRSSSLKLLMEHLAVTLNRTQT